MIGHELKPAEYIKGQVIDFYMNKKSNDLFIGNEVMYGFKRKVVDLLILHKKTSTAIEIKSDNDDLRRISEQIEGYKKIFDYIIICTTKEHLNKIQTLVSNDIGIYCIDKHKINIIRTPLKQKKLDRAEILFTINSSFLKKEVLKKSSKTNSDEIRKQFINKSINTIHNIFMDYLRKKVEPRFNLFLEYRGNFTLIDDIPVLSSPLFIQ